MVVDPVNDEQSVPRVLANDTDMNFFMAEVGGICRATGIPPESTCSLRGLTVAETGDRASGHRRLTTCPE